MIQYLTTIGSLFIKLLIDFEVDNAGGNKTLLLEGECIVVLADSDKGFGLVAKLPDHVAHAQGRHKSFKVL